MEREELKELEGKWKKDVSRNSRQAGDSAQSYPVTPDVSFLSASSFSLSKHKLI